MLDNLIKTITKSTAYNKFVAVLSICFHFLHKKFLWGLFSRIDEKFFKFLFVGFINTVFSYILYAFFVTLFSISFIELKLNYILETIFKGYLTIANLALFCQYIIGIMWNFKTTGSIVFKNNNNGLIFKFFGCYIFTFFLNSTLLWLLIDIFKINEYLAQAILVLPIAMVSFIILKLFVFKDSQTS